MKKFLVALGASLGLLFALSGAAARADVLNEIKERGELKVCLEPAYMPFEITDKRGQIVGFDPDLAALMAESLGVKLVLSSTAWDGIIPALITSKCDIIMSGMTITKERAETIDFSKPYMVIGQTVLLRKDLQSKVKSYKDLNKPKYKIASISELNKPRKTSRIARSSSPSPKGASSRSKEVNCHPPSSKSRSSRSGSKGYSAKTLSRICST